LSAVGIVNEREDTEVQSHSIFSFDLGWVGFLGCVLFDVETGVPRTSPVFFHRDVFHVGFVWDRSV
jgi:hypothetical protein